MNVLPKLRRPGSHNKTSQQFIGVGAVALVVVFIIYNSAQRVESTKHNNEPQNIVEYEQRLEALESALRVHALGIPQGKAKALPSLRDATADEDGTRATRAVTYGGKGDKAHLGGFTKYDGQGVSPAVWRHMMTDLGVKSIMDVGCGKGVSSLYFLEHGADVLCLEGSHDAVSQSLLPPSNVVEHDFSRGPYWPYNKTYDAVWSVEFLEHVGRNFQNNYIQAFRKAAFIFVSHSKWGGWHHVEVHDKEWWVTRFQMFGFTYSEVLTQKVREVGAAERVYDKEDVPDNPKDRQKSIGPDGEGYNAQHVWLNMLVFINPQVAALPEHAHLLAEPGCYKDTDRSTKVIKIVHKECDGKRETKLPDSFHPLKLNDEQHNSWLNKVKAAIGDTDTA